MVLSLFFGAPCRKKQRTTISHFPGMSVLSYVYVTHHLNHLLMLVKPRAFCKRSNRTSHMNQFLYIPIENMAVDTSRHSTLLLFFLVCFCTSYLHGIPSDLPPITQGEDAPALRKFVSSFLFRRVFKKASQYGYKRPVFYAIFI